MNGTISERLQTLRALMEKSELAAYVVPSADPHQSEYVASCWQRRPYISGFTGSAGDVAVTLDGGGLWTDSRYFLQAEAQLTGTGLELFRVGNEDVPEMEDWLGAVLSEGALVGADPWTFSLATWDGMKNKLKAHGVELVAVDHDLVEEVWGDDRPGLPASTIKAHSTEFAGVSVDEKLVTLAAALMESEADVYLMAALDEIAWFFNLRGADVDFNPVFIAYALITREGATLFTDPSRLDPAARAGLPACVTVAPYEGILDAIVALEGKQVWIDPAWVNRRLGEALGEAGAFSGRRKGPVMAWKAAKNPAEAAGIRRAHVRDGVAMVRFLRWLEEAVPAGGQTELTVEESLLSLRAEGERYVGPSFSSIVGYAGHGAIVHYRATPESCSALRPEGILLVDSGGQYLDGTTDITRTVTLGPPTPMQRLAYTAVLRGHLRLGHTRFAAGTDGYQLDILARSALWEEALDYGHGTGHGVGAYLCVHEGPFSVSLRKNLTPLVPGNVLSNEPGFYETGGFGIRIENLIIVVHDQENAYGRFLAFEPLTLCPYDRRLIDKGMLTPKEIGWVDAYHGKVRDVLSPHLEVEDLAWLQAATAAL
ncbi:MAG: aminopeptidase P family protein [Pseudomonadota bacterium]